MGATLKANRDKLISVGAGALLLLLFAGMSYTSWLGDEARAYSTYLLWAAFLCYAGIAYFHSKTPGWSLRTLFVAAVAMRVVMSVSFPVFSDDIWRYLWDGHVQLQGINPFLFAPDAPELAEHTTHYHHLINYPEIPTIYPGFSQLVFASVVGVGGGDTLMRLVFAAAEMAVVPAIWRLAGLGDEHGRSKRLLALLCWWNPMMVVEFAGSGHLDPLAFTPLAWGLAWIQGKGRAGEAWSEWAMAGALIGLSIAAKLVGGIGLFAIGAWAFYKAKSWSQRLKFALPRVAVSVGAALAIVTAVSVPYHTPVAFGQAANFGGTLSNYARKWRWNDGPYRLMFAAQEHALYQVEGASREKPPQWRFDAWAGLFKAAKVTHEHEGKVVASTTMPPWELAGFLVKLYTMGLLGLVALSILLLGVRPAPATMLIFGTALLCSAVVHPWYVAWMLPLALAHRVRGLVLWTGLATLSYVPQFAEMPWLLFVEYVPVVGLCVYAIWEGLLGVDGTSSWRRGAKRATG